MKKILMAATAIAGLGFASPALADGTNLTADTEQFLINAVNPPKCNLESNSNTVTLGANEISDNDGFARTDLQARIAGALNELEVNAWCTGNRNKIVLSRSSLNTGNGQATPDGFNQAVIYDIGLEIPGAVRLGGSNPVNEGTSDGPNSGPFIRRFGPDGDGLNVIFDFGASAISEAVTNGTTAEPARDFFTADSSRLVAGTYTGTVTVTLTPGL